MGQYWVLLNLDKRVSSGHLGKLGEVWYNGTRTFIFHRLLVPADPIPPRPEGESSDKGAITIGEWAGDRIICVGDYIGDYPPDVFTEQELKEIDASDNLYDLAGSAFKSIRGTKLRKEEAEAVDQEDRSWVLRNLSKKLFVQLDDIKDAGCGNVEQILLAHISWSTDPSSAMVHDITRGSWAGDRFDITLIENVLEGTGGPWEDVTEEVIARVKPILKSEDSREEESEWMMQKAMQARMESLQAGQSEAFSFEDIFKYAQSSMV